MVREDSEWDTPKGHVPKPGGGSLERPYCLEWVNYLVVAVNVFLGVASICSFHFTLFLETSLLALHFWPRPSLSIGTTLRMHSLFGPSPLPHPRWSSCDSWPWWSGSLPSLAVLGPSVSSQACPGVRMNACSREGMACEGHWKSKANISHQVCSQASRGSRHGSGVGSTAPVYHGLWQSPSSSDPVVQDVQPLSSLGCLLSLLLMISPAASPPLHSHLHLSLFKTLLPQFGA